MTLIGVQIIKQVVKDRWIYLVGAIRASEHVLVIIFLHFYPWVDALLEGDALITAQIFVLIPVCTRDQIFQL
jgi:hypothetical protein